jgi:hypothetical protein
MVLIPCWLDIDDFRIWTKSLLARCGLVPQLRCVLVKSIGELLHLGCFNLLGESYISLCLKIAPFP